MHFFIMNQTLISIKEVKLYICFWHEMKTIHFINALLWIANPHKWMFIYFTSSQFQKNLGPSSVIKYGTWNEKHEDLKIYEYQVIWNWESYWGTATLCSMGSIVKTHWLVWFHWLDFKDMHDRSLLTWNCCVKLLFLNLLIWLKMPRLL